MSENEITEIRWLQHYSTSLPCYPSLLPSPIKPQLNISHKNVSKMFTNVYKDEQKFSKVYERSISVFKKVHNVSGNIHKSGSYRSIKGSQRCTRVQKKGVHKGLQKGSERLKIKT